MLWLKAFHIIFVITWFAGLFYLPRLFIYHAQSDDAPSRDRFAVMERRLFVIMTIGAAFALVFGIAMIAANPALLTYNWLRLKLVLVAALVGYHVYCRTLIADLKRGHGRTQIWYRWFNELPAVALIAIVILAVVKPVL
jgi:putative membrane protein